MYPIPIHPHIICILPSVRTCSPSRLRKKQALPSFLTANIGFVSSYGQGGPAGVEGEDDDGSPSGGTDSFSSSTTTLLLLSVDCGIVSVGVDIVAVVAAAADVVAPAVFDVVIGVTRLGETTFEGEKEEEEEEEVDAEEGSVGSSAMETVTCGGVFVPD